ncbi:DUF4232 domain-containing protein [Saccharopolyspora halophila]|uniref:DUF4232 domain-containing protein n=1 Tax=Saccharopolyspora halophila TaxID=405551 RepID=UPI0031E01498
MTRPAPAQPTTGAQDSATRTSGTRTAAEESTADSEGTRTGVPEAEGGLACSSRELQMQLDPMGPDSGQQTTLEVTSTSGRMCQIRGCGGLRFADHDGNPLPTEINRMQADPPVIALQRSQSAGMDLTWDIYQAPCAESEVLQFTPPGETAPCRRRGTARSAATGWSRPPRSARSTATAADRRRDEGEERCHNHWCGWSTSYVGPV